MAFITFYQRNLKSWNFSELTLKLITDKTKLKGRKVKVEIDGGLFILSIIRGKTDRANPRRSIGPVCLLFRHFNFTISRTFSPEKTLTLFFPEYDKRNVLL